MRTSWSSRSAVAVAVLRVMPRWACSGSVICLPIFISGFSEVIGSWKIIAISLPQNWRICLGGEAERCPALEADRARALDVAASASRPMIERDEDRLARAGLADDAERLPALERERHAVDGPHDAAWRLEVRAQVGDLEQRAGLGLGRRPVSRAGSVTAPPPGCRSGGRRGRRSG